MANETPQILQGLKESLDPIAREAVTPQQIPLRPADQVAPPAAPGVATTPYEDQGGTLPHPVDHMAMAFMGNAVSEQKRLDAEATGQPPAAPGSFGDKLRGALDSAAAGLGDAAAAQGGDPHSGWLGAVGRVLNARTNRIEHQKEVNFDQQERLKNDQINLATANANLRQHVLTTHKLEKEDRDQDAAAGELFMSHLRAGSELAKGQPDDFNVQDHITNDQLMSMAKKDPKFMQTHTARVTGYEPVLNADGTPQKDANGFAIESPMYSVADIAEGDKSKTLSVTPELAKKWNDAGIKQVTPGTILPATMANKLDVQAQRYGTTLSILNHDKVQPLPDEVKDQMVTALQDPEVQHAVAMNPGSPLGGLYDAASNMAEHIKDTQAKLTQAQAAGNQQAVAALQKDLQDHQSIQQNLDKTISMGFTPAERSAYQKQTEADRKQTEVEQQNQKRDEETARHNRAMEQVGLLGAQGGSPELIADTGEKLANAEILPKDLPKRGKGGALLNLYAAADKSSWESFGKPYDAAQIEREDKYANQKSTRDTINLINSIVDPNGSLDIAMTAAKGLPQFDSQTANKVFNTVKGEFGSKSITDFQTAMLGLADEYSKVVGGGTGSDTGRQQALDLLKAGYAKGQFKGAENIIRQDIAARRRGIIGNNRQLQKDYYGSSGMTVTMVSPDGKSYQEVPRSQAQFYTSKGARVANRQDYTNLNIIHGDH